MSTDTLYIGRDWGVEHDRTVGVRNGELRYTTLGEGEPVLLIHCTSVPDGVVVPLVRFNPGLLERYQFISYHRAGYCASKLTKDSLSIDEGAEHARQLLDHLGIDRAHVVAYSFGGAIGLQFLVSYPERAHSAVLLEPYLPRESPAALTANVEAFTRAGELYARGDKLGATVAFMTAVCGEAYLSALDTTLPLNVWDQIEESADVTFQIDFPALGDWAFRMSQVDSLPGPRPTMPVLAMLGLDSDSVMPGFRETQQFLMRWLPQAERCGVAGVTHGLQVMNPVAVAEGISAFLGRHPINP